MSMRSIDVRNVIAKSKEVEGIQKAQNRVATTGQEAFEAELSKQAKETSDKVQSSPKTQHEKIRNDDRRRGRNRKKDKQDKRMIMENTKGGKDKNIDDSKEDHPMFPGQIIDVEV